MEILTFSPRSSQRNRRQPEKREEIGDQQYAGAESASQKAKMRQAPKERERE